MGERRTKAQHPIAQDSRSLTCVLATIAAAVVYGIGDLVSGLLYEGYRHGHQAISELTAFGSPVRPLMLTAMIIHGLLLLAFGVGLLRLSRETILRWVGRLFIAAWVVGLPTHTIWAMSSRWMQPGFNDTMHIAGTIVWSLLIAAAVVLSAVAYKGGFRIYAIATLAVMVGFGVAASIAMKGLEQDATPWVGVFERINAYAYFAWVIVLAMTWLRHHAEAPVVKLLTAEVCMWTSQPVGSGSGRR